MEKVIDIVAAVLLVLAGVTWGLVGVADFNLVTTLFGVGVVSKVFYIAFGVAAVYAVFKYFKEGSCCCK